MVQFKRKKKVRMRGSHTHGWGSKKKHRGAGNRGGRGMAGTGKKADHKRPSIIKEYGTMANYFGKKGFHRPGKVIVNQNPINICELNQFKEGELNLNELGYTKLLGKGVVKKKFIITVAHATEKAKQKIEKVGGKLVV